jgi:tRNA/rRNA methyltransferase
MKIHFVLVEPAVPENIGAAARAIKTMGFDSLWIVNSSEYLKNEAGYLAHGSGDILEHVTHFSTYNEMIDALDFSIATTSKFRSVKNDYINGNDLPKILEEKNRIIKNAGIIFGREEYGLKNEEIKLCDLTSSIPLFTSYPSLNLGQSVMLYAYVLSKLNKLNIEDTNQKDHHFEDELDALKKKVEKILPYLNLDKNTNIYGRIFERLMHVNQDDIHLLHSIANKLIDQNDLNIHE